MAASATLITFLAVQSFVYVAWWRWVGARDAALTRAERLLCAAVLSIAQIVGASLLLGWVGWLALAPLLTVTLAASAATLFFSGDRFQLPGGAGLSAGAGRPAPPGKTAAALRVGIAGLALLFAVALVIALIRDALLPDPGWDGLKYHLPMSALMRQTQGLDFPAVHNPVIAGYPRNGEIWAHWILTFFGDERWVDLAQLPFLLLAVLATYAIARRLGSQRAAAAIGALLLPFAPVVLMQITTAYTDVALSALLLAAVALLLVRRDDASPAVGLSFGAALGLLIGSKFSGLGFGSILFAAFAFVVLRARRRESLAGLAGVALLAVLLGGDAYARNWRRHGNPFFPYRTSIAGLELPGPSAATQVYGVRETRDLSPFERQRRSWAAVDVVNQSALFGGFGITGPFLAAISLLSFVLALRARDRSRLAVFVIFAALFAVTPLNFRLRFVIYLLGLGGVSLAHGLDRAGPRWRALLIAAALGVAGFSTVQFWQTTLATRWRDPAVWSARADPCRDAEPPPFRAAYAWLRQQAPVGSTLVVFPGPDELFPYCLWTPSFSNRVAFAATADLTPYGAEAILFLPHRSEAYARFSATDPVRWRTLFANDAVTLAAPADPPLADPLPFP